ncbi:type II toxin-antitoxin system HicB family antitoxin [Flavimarina sp. Hel_I_48]|uniref:type II toxin-antitoxin system HicB family antitoxin n=1 Tax=Flavimarina sp. Hel_I_48 TaxID=1392488 RepID=UPI000AE62AFD|nr:hypothetical protein [Flavimarina sp. Hel_I_48]
MKEKLEHKGYFGTVQFSTDDKVFFGKIQGINDLILFEGKSVSDLEKSFVESVEDYLKTCKEIGKEIVKNGQPERLMPDFFDDENHSEWTW